MDLLRGRGLSEQPRDETGVDAAGLESRIVEHPEVERQVRGDAVDPRRGERGAQLRQRDGSVRRGAR
jgi:hypothetical protein